MYVLGPDDVVIDRLGAEVWRDRVRSTDGGSSWQAVETWRSEENTRPLSTGPITGLCMEEPYTRGECGDIGTMDPASGATVSAPTQPPLDFKQVGSSATEDDRWWVTGRDQTTGRWAISVSADGGETWATNEVAVDGTPNLDDWAVVDRNGVMYATATTPRALLGVWRSTDDGRSWIRTWTGGDGQELPGILGMPIAAGDGSLILPTGTTTYVSTDQGHTFKPTGDELFGMVTWTRAGYLRSNVDEFALSSDGLRWREFTVR